MSYTNAQIVLNSRDATGGSRQQLYNNTQVEILYNDCTYNAQNPNAGGGGGQNIIQGSIREIAVSEVNFPYDIPNIQDGFNTFELIANLPVGLGTPSSVPGDLYITIPPGFYSGSELATAINAVISAQQILVEDVSGNAPTVAYDGTSNRFTFNAPANAPPGNPTPTWAVFSPYTYPYNYRSATNTLGKDILSIMGFLPAPNHSAAYTAVSSDTASGLPTTFVSQGAAPLVFTQYIDICSDKLTSNQMFQGGSTTNLARRQNVLCRMFICDNVSLTTTEVEGTRPFILNRQYVNARVMKWSVESSIPTIDIQLYDDVGQPLAVTWAPRPYQITFNCYERSQDYVADRDDEEHGSIKPPPRYASYQEGNVSRAWKNLARQ